MVNSISVLGSTGSIGRQTLAAAAELGIRVAAIAGSRNIDLLEKQARELKCELVAVYDEAAARTLETNLAGTGVRVVSGMGGLTECAAQYGECVVTAVSGSVGLTPTLAAIDAKKRIALANKETLVCAGEIVMERAREKGAEIIPVDSEHSAIFQCLLAEGDRRALRRILLTGSGGPFRGLSREETADKTPAQAVAHPNWSMGAKISVDSATLMNKGLEFIEAMHLFGVSPDMIKVIIHPESIIHSMVEFEDGAILAQMGVPDMGVPIRYALTYPERRESAIAVPDLAALGSLTFSEPDLKEKPCLALAMDCARRGGTAAAVMSAANEAAVGLFLDGRLGFNAIYDITAAAVEKLSETGRPTLDALQNADGMARRFVADNFGNF